MEFSDFIEFKQLRNIKVAFHFKIELKIFNCFKKTFVTDKYISLIQWEQIEREIVKIAQSKAKSSASINRNHEEHFEADGCFRVQYKFVLKEDSYIDFSKLNYELPWIMKVQITRLSLIPENPQQKTNVSEVPILEEEPYFPLNGTPERSPIIATQEYSPSSRSPQIEPRKNRYTPSKTKNTISPSGYSPKHLDTSFNVLSSKYTPTKINKNFVDSEVVHEPEATKNKRFNYADLFGDEPEDSNITENKNVNPDSDETSLLVELERSFKDSSGTVAGEDDDESSKSLQISQHRKSSRPRKRIFPLPSDSSPEKPTSVDIAKKLKKTKIPKDKTGFAQPKPKKGTGSGTLDVWISTNKTSSKTPSKVTQRNKSKKEEPSCSLTNLSSASNRNDELKKMNEFLEKAKMDEEKRNKRRLELEDFEIWHCNDLTNDYLKKLVKDFAPNIRTHFANPNAVSSKNKKFDPVEITTSNILTEKQCEYVLQQIENQRHINDRGQNEDILMDRILPEFIVYVFCEKFNLSETEALNRLTIQEERRSLYCNDSIMF